VVSASAAAAVAESTLLVTVTEDLASATRVCSESSAMIIISSDVSDKVACTGLGRTPKENDFTKALAVPSGNAACAKVACVSGTSPADALWDWSAAAATAWSAAANDCLADESMGTFILVAETVPSTTASVDNTTDKLASSRGAENDRPKSGASAADAGTAVGADDALTTDEEARAKVDLELHP